MPESTRYEHLDRLTRAELGDWQGAANALDDWMWAEHGHASSGHHLGHLLDRLADAGYVVLNPAEIHGWVADGVPPARWVTGADIPFNQGIRPMSHRWHPPGTGWNVVGDDGWIVLWMRPEKPGGASIALYYGDCALGVQDVHSEVWIVRVPRGSFVPVNVLDKPHRISHVERYPGDPQFGGQVLLHEPVRPSHAGHRRCKRSRRLWADRLPRKIWLAIRPEEEINRG